MKLPALVAAVGRNRRYSGTQFPPVGAGLAPNQTQLCNNVGNCKLTNPWVCDKQCDCACVDYGSTNVVPLCDCKKNLQDVSIETKPGDEFDRPLRSPL
jgi:hypothetical protein